MPLLSDIEIAEDRAFANDNMPDTCLIERVSATTGAVFDQETGQYDLAATRTTVYTGRCRVQIRADINTNLVEPIELERQWGYLTSTLQLPIVGSENIRNDDVATIVTCKYDDALVGREFNLEAPTYKSHATVRRFRLREPIR